MTKLVAASVVMTLLLPWLLPACTFQTQCVAAYAALSLEEAIAQSTLIVLGTVDSVTRQPGQGRELETPAYVATVIIEQTVRGEAVSGEPIYVRMICEPHLKQGEHVFLLLAGQPAAARLVGGPESVYLLTADGRALNRMGEAYPERNTTLAQLLALSAE